MNINKLKAIRTELGLNQKEFAEVIGIKYDTYTRKESKGSFTFEEVLKIVDVAKSKGVSVSLEELRA